MGAAMQLSAVTSHLTANLAPIPLLWILPLAVYLLTIILAFQFPHMLARGLVTRLLIVFLGSLAYMLSKTDFSLPLRISMTFFLIEVLVSCYFCHSEAVALRPARTSESTIFYLLFAAGGALGSFLIGIASPLLFRYNYDLALTFLVTALLAFAVTWKGGWNQRMLWGVASIMMAVLVAWLHIAYQRETIAAARNFYGTLRVRQNHGYPGFGDADVAEWNHPARHAILWYRKAAPTADDLLCRGFRCRPGSSVLLSRAAAQYRCHRLGAGTIAAYGRPGDRIRFYEINPAVPPIAKNVFTYIRDSGAQVEIVEGDGRLSLMQEELPSISMCWWSMRSRAMRSPCIC